MSDINGRLLNIPNVNDFKRHLDTLDEKTAELESTKQDKLIPGENIKNIDGNSVIGSGNIPFKTVNGEPITGEGNINIHNEPLTIDVGKEDPVIYDGSITKNISVVTLDTYQEIEEVKAFEAPIYANTILGHNGELRLADSGGEDAFISLNSNNIRLCASTVYYNSSEIATEDKVVHNSDNEEIYGNKVFNDDTIFKATISNNFDTSIAISDISTATNLENGTGDGSIIQANTSVDNITWASSDPSIVNVDEVGNIVAVESGTATITATAEDGAMAECEVQVLAPTTRRTTKRLFSKGLLRNATNDTVVALNISTYASEQDPQWGNQEQHLEIIADDNITITTSDGKNNGKYYTSGGQWRLYQSDGATLTFTCSDSSKIIKSVSVTYSSQNSGTVIYNGESYGSGSVIDGINNQAITIIIGNTGSATNGQVRATDFNIVYGEPTVEEIVLNKDNISIALDGSFQLIATTYPESASSEVSWSSDDETIVTVDETGLVKAVSSGNTLVHCIATDGGGAEATCSVEVTSTPIIHVEEVNVTPIHIVTYVDFETQLTASIIPENADDQEIIWSSDDESVATVDANGLVTATGLGTTYIYATAHDTFYEAEGVCEIEVVETPKFIHLNASNITLNVGDGAKLVAKYNDKNIASGKLAIALGLENTVSGDSSVAIGTKLVSENSNQFVIGSFNRNKSTTLFEVGNGTSSARSNAFEVYTDGSAKVYVDPVSNNDLTRKSYVDNLVSTKANDNAVVHLVGNETIDGQKIFSDTIQLSAWFVRGGDALLTGNTAAGPETILTVDDTYTQGECFTLNNIEAIWGGYDGVIIESPIVFHSNLKPSENNSYGVALPDTSGYTEDRVIATETYVDTKIPDCPAADGTYLLKASRVNGQVTYSWVLDEE